MKEKPYDGGWNRACDNQQSKLQAGIFTYGRKEAGFRRLPAVTDNRNNYERDILPEKDKNGNKCAQMDAYVEKKLGFRKSENMLKEHKMSGAAYRQKFRQSLDNPQNYCLKNIHVNVFVPCNLWRIVKNNYSDGKVKSSLCKARES